MSPQSKVLDVNLWLIRCAFVILGLSIIIKYKCTHIYIKRRLFQKLKLYPRDKGQYCLIDHYWPTLGGVTCQYFDLFYRLELRNLRLVFRRVHKPRTLIPLFVPLETQSGAERSTTVRGPVEQTFTLSPHLTSHH